MMKSVITSAVISSAIDDMANKMTHKIMDLVNDYEVVTETTARTSHGRTNSTTTTTIRQKPKPEKVGEEWVIQPQGWEPHVDRRADGLKELWGYPESPNTGRSKSP